MYAQTLLNFGFDLNIDSDTIKRSETPERFALSSTIHSKDAKNLDETKLKVLTDVFNDAVTLEVRSAVISLFQLSNTTTEQEIHQGLNDISETADTTDLEIELIIEKGVLLNALSLSSEVYDSRLYFFLDNLCNFLDQSLPKLDNLLFSSNAKPSIIFVSDTQIDYSGQLLKIVNIDNSARWNTEALSSHFVNRINRYRSVASENLKWLNFSLSNLTPLHFLVNCVGARYKELENILNKHLASICILYTADRSTFEETNGTYDVDYISKDRTAHLRVNPNSITTFDSKLIAQLAIWSYSGKGTDQLHFLQEEAARTLSGERIGTSQDTFFRNLKRILEDARWHYKVFLSGKVNKHLEQTQQVSSYVRSAAREVSQTLDSVTKGLTETLLATIGVIVVTLLAALIRFEASGLIIRVAMIGYSLFLFFIQGLYRLGSIWHSYCLLGEEVDEQKKDFEDTLGAQKVANLLTTLEKRKGQFWWWFWGTAIIYLLVAAGIMVLGFVLPGWLDSLNLSTTSTQTP